MTVPATRRRAFRSAIKIVVTGPYNAGKSTLIRTISDITVLSTEREASESGASDSGAELAETTVAMDFGRITIDDDLVLYLFGTPGQERFRFMWEILGEGMLGYVVLVDFSRPESLDEASSILEAFRGMARVPFIVALNRTDGLDFTDESLVRQALALTAEVPVVPCDATDRESVKAVLLALLHTVAAAMDRAPAGA